jgi:TPR repeat protein
MMSGVNPQNTTEPNLLPTLEESAKWCQAAASQGHGPSQMRLSNLFKDGRGVRQDLGEAYFWFKLAQQRHAEGTTAQGFDEHTLKSIPMDDWFKSKLSTEQVNSIGQPTWKPTPTDITVKNAAARIASAQAEGRLSFIASSYYEMRAGVPYNAEDAYFWATVAQLQEPSVNPNFMAYTAEAEKSLSASQKNVVEKRIQAWKAANPSQVHQQ